MGAHRDAQDAFKLDRPAPNHYPPFLEVAFSGKLSALELIDKTRVVDGMGVVRVVVRYAVKVAADQGNVIRRAWICYTCVVRGQAVGLSQELIACAAVLPMIWLKP